MTDEHKLCKTEQEAMHQALKESGEIIAGPKFKYSFHKAKHQAEHDKCHALDYSGGGE